MEQQLTELESISIIESMIKRAKNNFSESGTLYLLWGIVVFICSLVQFIAVHFYNYTEAYRVWLLTWVVLIYHIFFLSKQRRKKRVKTYSDDIIKYVWLCFVCCMFAAVFILQYQKALDSISPVILILYSVPTFLSGAILKFKPLMIGGALCWPLAIGSVFVATDLQAVFVCCAVLVAWIIPGIYLRKKYLKENI